jgi:hemolysin III
MATIAPQPRVKPRLRGVSHQIAAFFALPAAAMLVMGANGGSAVAGALTYGASLVTLFSVSALYHRPMWSPRARSIMWRLDHSAIFVLIAGTYTPLCLLVGPGLGHGLLTVVWIGAVIGMLLSIAWPTAPKKLMAALYVALGWFAVAGMPAMRDVIGDRALALLVTGGLLYTAGAVIYATRKPDPFPTVFGFHEIFHLAVVLAAICHFLVVTDAIGRLGHPVPKGIPWTGAAPFASPENRDVVDERPRASSGAPDRQRRGRDPAAAGLRERSGSARAAPLTGPP